MLDGIYKATFAVGISVGDGIVVIRDGYVGGGDHGFTYEGTLDGDRDNFQGQLTIKQWDATVPNVFPGLTEFELNLAGKIDGMAVRLKGATAAAPGTVVNVTLMRLR
jgi:hypothetical protein